MAAEVTQKNLVEIRDLDVIYQTRVGPVSAIDDVSMDIFQGEILGLVGESPHHVLPMERSFSMGKMYSLTTRNHYGIFVVEGSP